MNHARLNVVKALALPRRLGIRPRTVARHLGAAEKTVPHWAHGRLPMSPRYRPPFRVFLREQVQHAKAHPLPAPAPQASPYPPERSPVLAYLARQSPDDGRNTLRRRLESAAALLSGGRAGAMAFPWHALTEVRVLALRTTLRETRSMRTTNATPYTVRGVGKERWRLELMTAEQRDRIRDVPAVKGGAGPRAACRRPGSF